MTASIMSLRLLKVLRFQLKTLCWHHIIGDDIMYHILAVNMFYQSSVYRFFFSFKPPSKPLGPPFYLTMSSINPLYWPDPGWVKFQLWYLEVPGLLVTTLQSCLVQCCKEVQYLLQNKMSTWDMCSASCFNSRESEFAVTNENKITPKDTNILRMYLLNCCFGLNKNDDFWQLWVYYQWRAQYVEEPGMMIIEM